MSYTIVLNSNNRSNPNDSVSDAIYNFNWSVLEPGEYKVTWKLCIAGAYMTKLILATPVTGNTFIANSLTVGNETYITSASSYGDSFFPYRAFNGVASTTFYHSQYQATGGSIAYSQSPYLNGAYRGGGSVDTFFATTSTTGIIAAGEWLQIRLPYSLQLTSYSIKQRVLGTRYIASFYIMASNNGINWVSIDRQTVIPQSWDNLTFSLATRPLFYTYFRIIFTSLAVTIDGESINITNWSPSGNRSIS
jgi:hypothetical protein